MRSFADCRFEHPKAQQQTILSNSNQRQRQQKQLQDQIYYVYSLQRSSQQHNMTPSIHRRNDTILKFEIGLIFILCMKMMWCVGAQVILGRTRQICIQRLQELILSHTVSACRFLTHVSYELCTLPLESKTKLS